MDVNSTDYLVETESVSANNRYFDNTSMRIPVQVGNYLEFKRLHPTWATNPLTNVVGGTAWINTTDIYNIDDGYPIHTFALTHTPGDAQTSYFGYRPIAPSTTGGTNKIYIRQAGRITKAGVYSYSGTAGSAETWTMYIRVNNAQDYLIQAQAVSANERMWINTSMNIPVVAGDYVEIKSVTSTMATNPATTIYGGGFYMEYEDELPVSIFQTNVTMGTSPLAVQFTESTTLDSTGWEWYWTCAENATTALFSTAQNPENVFDNGHFQISLNVTNASGYRYNASSVIISSSPSGGYNGFTQQDIYLTGQYLITFNVKSSTTNLPIANVTVVDSVSGQSYPSTNGTAFLTLPAGLYYINFIADGYQTRQVTYVVDQDETHAVTMVAADTTAPVYNVYPPKDVKFHITSFFGSPISNANVTIQGVTTSTGNWDWLVTLLGISLDEVAINGTAMSEVTDSNGDAVFLMLPSVKYNITTTASGYTFPSTIIAPQATEYTITANWNESWFSSGNDTLKDVNVSVSWVKINSTHSFVNITYDDQTTTTTGGDFRIYREAATRMANATPIAVMNITSSSCSNSTIVNTPTGGAEYRVDVNASTTSGDRVLRTFTHSFKGAPVNLPGWTPETQLWLALFILIFTAAFAGVLHAPQMGVILCVELWVFWSIGWMEYLINGNGYTEAALLIIFTLATFFTVVWSITEGKSKGKRSS